MKGIVGSVVCGDLTIGSYAEVWIERILEQAEIARMSYGSPVFHKNV